MRRLALITCAFGCLAILFGAPALAGGQLHVVTNEQVLIGASTGTFTFSGDVSDGGFFTFDSFFSAGPPAFFQSTEHVIQTYHGGAGTLTVEKQCLSVFIGGGIFSDTCRAGVIGGTGAYEGEHGGGSCSGVINLLTGIASQTCDLRLTS